MVWYTVSPSLFQPLWQHEVATPTAACATSPSSTVDATTLTAPPTGAVTTWGGVAPPMTTTQNSALDSAPWLVSVCVCVCVWLCVGCLFPHAVILRLASSMSNIINSLSIQFPSREKFKTRNWKMKVGELVLRYINSSSVLMRLIANVRHVQMLN